MPEKQLILVVKDESAIRNLLQAILEAEGFDVRLAADGEKGLQQARELGPDLVLLDLNLPRADGLEVCRKMRGSERTKRLPILYVTGGGDEHDRYAGLRAGANAYLAKPFNRAELMASVRSAL